MAVTWVEYSFNFASCEPLKEKGYVTAHRDYITRTDQEQQQTSYLKAT